MDSQPAVNLSRATRCFSPTLNMRLHPLIDETSEFSLERAILLAVASDIAYEQAPAMHANWAEKSGFQQTESFDHGNTQGFWAHTPVEDGVALLVFRGTSNLGQWVRDAKLAPIDHTWGHVHCGFDEGLGHVHADLEEFDHLAAASKHVFVTGHSLGGALAVLAAARLKIQNETNAPVVYTFGQPRAALGDFTEKFDQQLPGRFYRLINQKDIVSRLPPGLIYRHGGTPKRIVRPGKLESRAMSSKIVIKEGEEELPDIEITDELLKQLDQFDPGSRKTEEGLLAVFSDHRLPNYIRLLKEIETIRDS